MWYIHVLYDYVIGTGLNLIYKIVSMPVKRLWRNFRKFCLRHKITEISMTGTNFISSFGTSFVLFCERIDFLNIKQPITAVLVTASKAIIGDDKVNTQRNPFNANYTDMMSVY